MISALPKPSDWVHLSLQISAKSARAVLAMVTRERGSTPRDSGSWILVSDNAVVGTIGGGEFERAMTEAARAMLRQEGSWRRAFLETTLGPDMRQCCGGAMQILLQPIDPSSPEWLRAINNALEHQSSARLFFSEDALDESPQLISGPENRRSSKNSARGFSLELKDNWPRVALFGAGHVGRAVCTIGSQLPMSITVFDERADQCALIPKAKNVCFDARFDPLSGAASLRGFAAALIMTHSHTLDFELCEILLKNPELAYLGLIGSESKSVRFKKRLTQAGLATDALSRLISPIGKGGPPGKEPGVIALSVLSEMMHAIEHAKKTELLRLIEKPAA
mgnify:FL=1